MASVVAACVAVATTVAALVAGAGSGLFETRSPAWWGATTVLHIPYIVILCFLIGGLVERLGFYWKGRAPATPGLLPPVYPTVCVQLPMFEEPAVAARVIEAACRMSWPAGRLEVQVLDDSTDPDVRALVRRACANAQEATGVRCTVHHRERRDGYKAGALEDGRRNTDAEFLAIFDADFVPPPDFLVRVLPHFYRGDGRPEAGLALVQAQWGHLNHDQSPLTRAQSLWVDDHHTLQMSFRSAAMQFVNFTGTAGVWRSSSIEHVGGWRAASLVEDCELSFRHLFAGYRTKFVKEIVAPAELPATYASYKSQQRRWTQGWVQLQRLHLGTLLFRFPCTLRRRVFLLYHMCMSWQWAAWAIWITLLPVLIFTDQWFGSLGLAVGVGLYLVPPTLWAAVTAVVASNETRNTYAEPLTSTTARRRIGRIVPQLVINTGMLAHQSCAFAEGLFGPLHSEFERTPKSAAVTVSATASERGSRSGENGAIPGHAGRGASKPARNHGRRPYAVSEAFFVTYQLGWAGVFAANGMAMSTIGAAYVAACVGYIGVSGKLTGRR